MKVGFENVFGPIDRYIALIVLLPNRGAEIDSRNRLGWTPLHKAASMSDEEMVRVLLENGAGLTLTTYDDGTTPLHLAASKGSIEIMRFFVEAGADSNAGENSPTTALHETARGGYLEAAAFLLEKGAKVNCRDRTGQTPLHSVVWSGNTWPKKMVQLFIDSGADIEAVNINGMTLQKAVMAGFLEEFIDCLIANGANVDVKDPEGLNLYQLARKHQRFELAHRFQRRSARTKSHALR